jgi:hypothetical protein
MKNIIYYAAIFVSLAGATALGVWSYRLKTEVALLQNTIARQEALIKELAAMETVGITITNNFKTNAVLGKATVSAAVENNARQVANILKGELVKGTRSDTTTRLQLPTGSE